MDGFKEPRRSAASCVAPAWAIASRGVATAVAALRTETGVTATVSLLPATLVTGCANAATHELYNWPAATVAVAAVVGTGYLGIQGLRHKWSPSATWVFLGTSAVTLDIAAVVVGQGWTDVFAWGAFAAASLGGRLAFRHGTAESRARTATEDAKSRAMDAKSELTLIKAQTEQIVAQLKAAQLVKATTPEPPPYAPNLHGFTAEEAALRVAFWSVYSAELERCDVQPTRTGYTATVGLPVGLYRDQVRGQWDRVATALRAGGRFVLSDGGRTNELRVKFLDAGMRSTTDVTWTPDRISADPLMASLGIDTETDEPVLIQADERYLVCGASGTGKSWATRPLMAHAHTHGSVFLFDAKGEESIPWQGIIRVATETDEILDGLDEVHAEMGRRKEEMRRRGISVWDGEQLTVQVDEGQVVLALVAGSGKSAKGRMQRFREIASLGRSRGVVLGWATQKPVMSPPAPGVDNLIAPNLMTRFSLRVVDRQESQTALDDCAFYGPHEIPDDKSMRGHGYLKGYGPSLIRVWTMDDDAVRTLTPRVWGSSVASASGISDEDKVTRHLMVDPNATVSSIAAATGLPAAAVRRITSGNR